MGRRSIPSTTLAAAVRKYYGLTQTELGGLLGLTRGQVAHVEAGRHLFSPAAEAPLFVLAPYVFATPPPAPAATPPPLAPPAAGPLAARLDRCQHEATQLRRELRALTHTCTHAQRWQQALPTMLATAPDERATCWLLRRQEQAAADLDADTAARYHLLRLRAEALETEAAALAALLGKAE